MLENLIQFNIGEITNLSYLLNDYLHEITTKRQRCIIEEWLFQLLQLLHLESPLILKKS